jgi:DNA-binding transcriptional ArsR family regulator
MNGADPLNDLAEVYHSLSASRRCQVIRILANSDDSELSVRALARRIAAIEEGVPPERATGEPYRNVYNALSQTHLSTLSEAGIIIYDSDRQTVTPGSNLDTALLLLVLNKATYQTLQGDSMPDLADFNRSSTTD